MIIINMIIHDLMSVPQSGNFLICGFIRLLFQCVTALSDAPCVGLGEATAERPSSGRLEGGPVILAGPSPDPRLGVHFETAPVGQVLFRSERNFAAAFSAQFLADGANVVSLEPAASADIPDAQ